MSEPFAALSKYVDRGKRSLTRARGKTHKSAPVSTKYCTLVCKSVTKRRLEFGHTSFLAEFNDCLFRFLTRTYKVRGTFLLYQQNVGGTSISLCPRDREILIGNVKNFAWMTMTENESGNLIACEKFPDAALVFHDANLPPSL